MNGSFGRGSELVSILSHDMLFEFTLITSIAVGLVAPKVTKVNLVCCWWFIIVKVALLLKPHSSLTNMRSCLFIIGTHRSPHV